MYVVKTWKKSLAVVFAIGAVMSFSGYLYGFVAPNPRETVMKDPQLYAVPPSSFIEIELGRFDDMWSGTVDYEYTYSTTEPVRLVSASNPSLVLQEIKPTEKVTEAINHTRQTYIVNENDEIAFFTVQPSYTRLVVLWWEQIGFLAMWPLAFLFWVVVVPEDD